MAATREIVPTPQFAHVPLAHDGRSGDGRTLSMLMNHDSYLLVSSHESHAPLTHDGRSGGGSRRSRSRRSSVEEDEVGDADELVLCLSLIEDKDWKSLQVRWRTR